MSRQLATKVEITKMIQDRIREGKELDGDCRNVTITSVYWHEEDESGCNWDLGYSSGPDSCRYVIRAITDEFRQLYNLNDD